LFHDKWKRRKVYNVFYFGERVETGGLVSFDYGKKRSSKLSKSKEREIGLAYEKYYERRKREKRNKLII